MTPLKSALPTWSPVTSALPALSTATPSPKLEEPERRFLDHTWAPVAPENFATNIPYPPPIVLSVGPPKLMLAVNAPVTSTSPLPSTATPKPSSSPDEPNRFAHRKPPVAEYLATKMSFSPALLSAPPPKSTAFWKYPVTNALPLRSRAIPVTPSFPVPPIRRDHTGVPSAKYFARNASSIPPLLSAPPPKSTVPVNDPPTSTLPLPSVVMALPLSALVPPHRFAQRSCPVPTTGHVGVFVLTVVLIPEAFPALSTALTA